MTNKIQAPLKIVEYNDSNSIFFKTINEEWITEMFTLEKKDLQVLNFPEEKIIQPGGCILFAETKDLGIVGTGALLKTGPHQYELTKMGVLKKARGLGAGEFILKALIQRALTLQAQSLYLLTNKKCESAIHLYEKNGFSHSTEIMKEFGADYQRCDVAMKYALK